MNPKELRVGNFVYDTFNKTPEVAQFTLDDFVVAGNFARSGRPIPYEPIPITKMWLLEFEWKQCDSFTEAYHFNGYRFVLSRHGKWIEFGDNEGIDIKYVHQLQNLYFALTGEELTINKDD